MPRLIAIANQKGGVGKTTTTMSLAAVAAETSKTLVVDTDPQRSATWWASRASDALPFDVATDVDPNNLARLRELAYDMVFIDTPGSLEKSDVLATVVAQADFVILPTEPTPLSVDPLVNTITQIVKPTGVDYRVLINKVDPRVPQDAEDAAELFDGAGLQRFKTVVRNYKIHTTSPIDGRVVTQYPDSRIAMKAVDDFRRVALEMVSIWANATTPIPTGAN